MNAQWSGLEIVVTLAEICLDFSPGSNSRVLANLAHVRAMSVRE